MLRCVYVVVHQIVQTAAALFHTTAGKVRISERMNEMNGKTLYRSPVHPLVLALDGSECLEMKRRCERSEPASQPTTLGGRKEFRLESINRSERNKARKGFRQLSGRRNAEPTLSSL